MTTGTTIQKKLVELLNVWIVDSGQGTAQYYHSLIDPAHPGRYTVHQVRRSLIWMVDNNPDIHTKLTGFNFKTRVYWYEPGN